MKYNRSNSGTRPGAGTAQHRVVIDAKQVRGPFIMNDEEGRMVRCLLSQVYSAAYDTIWR